MFVGRATNNNVKNKKYSYFNIKSSKTSENLMRLLWSITTVTEQTDRHHFMGRSTLHLTGLLKSAMTALLLVWCPFSYNPCTTFASDSISASLFISRLGNCCVCGAAPAPVYCHLQLLPASEFDECSN